ncbi:MAG: hypothetical protein ACTSVY_14220 [Candidatus Helarchaeota archaeon]
MVLNYTKNSEVHVFEGENKIQNIRSRKVDMFFEGECKMKVSKTMEILEISAKIQSEFSDKCSNALSSLEKIKGRRIGGGITKMVYGVVGKKCPYLAALVMECIEGAILGVTAGPLEKAVPQLLKSPKDFTKKKLIKYMPHMKNSCIAYTIKET